MIENKHEEHKHLLDTSDMTPFQRFTTRILWRIFELSTLEVLIALAHFTLTFVVVFWGVGKGAA